MKKLLILLLGFLIGCKMSQPIVYKTTDIKQEAGVRPIPISVNLRILQDNRIQQKGNKLLFNYPRELMLDGEKYCINSEEHYKKDPVAFQITRLLAEHFNKVRLFNFTFFNVNNANGYYLTGILNSFYAEQKFSTGAAIGSQFGLIGAIATAGIKSPGKIIFEIADMKLYDKNDSLIKDLGSFYKEYDEDFSADANCWCVYYNANAKLKDFNTHLAEKIRTDLMEIKFE